MTKVNCSNELCGNCKNGVCTLKELDLYVMGDEKGFTYVLCNSFTEGADGNQ